MGGVEYESVEEDSVTLRFITESMLHTPPAIFQRACLSKNIDLGAAGRGPKGCRLSLLTSDPAFKEIDLENPLYQNQQESNATRHDIFGGKQPHACVAKNLALLGLQVFLRELCSKYKFDVLTAVFEPHAGFAGWRDDLPVRICHI